nr:hypothetical protein [uncultured Carboxylicivirga sp.]
MNRTFTMQYKVKNLLVFALLFSTFFGETLRADEKPAKKTKVFVYEDGNFTISSVSEDFPFDLKYQGIIEISNDDKMINSISPGGFVEINKTAFGNNRRLFIHSDDNSQLTYEYYVGKTKTSFEPEGKKWLAEILPDIVAKSDLGIESRIHRIYNKEGLDAVFEMIENRSSTRKSRTEWSFFSMETVTVSGKSKTNALKTLIFDNQLKNQDLQRIIDEVGDIRSNSTKGTLLRFILENYELNVGQAVALLEAVSTHEYNTERGSTLRMFNAQYSDDFIIRKAYFDIIDDMEINSEKGNVLKDLIRKKTLSNDTWISLLNVVSDFSSEREKGAVLLFALPYIPKDNGVMAEFRSVLDDMSDSYYVLKGEITTAMLESGFSTTNQKPDKGSLLSYLRTAENISSNSQRGQILRKANRLFINDDEVIDAYFAVLNSMDSEMEVYNIMLDLLDKNKLNEKAMYRLLRQTSNLVPDFQHGAGAILRQVIQQFPLTDSNYNQFFQIIERMDQNSTIEELLRMVIDHPVLNDKLLIKVMECNQRIEVDVEKAAILVRISPHIPGKDSSVQYIFQSMTKELESEYEKNRVLKTIR